MSLSWGAGPRTMRGVTATATQSHRITRANGKVIVHDLELFMAFDPTIDDPDTDPAIAEWTNDRLKNAIEQTREFMSRKAYPQVVVEHDNGKGQAVRSAVGRVLNMRYEERGDVGYAVGDVEYPEGHFDQLVATNKFPRRSAEIWDNNDHISEVALLGRVTPRRPLPDTYFSRPGTRTVFSQMDYAGIGGGGNAFVPSTSKKEHDMDTADEVLAAIGKLCMEYGKRKNEMPAAEPAKEENAKGDPALTIQVNSLKESFAKITAENAALQERIEKAENERRRMEFSREVDQMEASGYQIAASDKDAVIADIAGSDKPAERIEFWKRNLPRLPINQRVQTQFAALPSSSAPLTKEEMEKVQNEILNDPELSEAQKKAKMHKWLAERNGSKA